jgi:predicted lipoprotein
MVSRKFLIIAVALPLIAGCDKDEETTEFDRKAMLNNMATAVIIPAFNQLNTDLTDLDASAQTFTATPNTLNLQVVRADFLVAYKSFQKCKMYDFGPMMDQVAKSSMNTYPTDISQIENNISTGSWDLDAVSNIDAIGFPAIDYLLYPAFSSESAAIDSFTTGSSANARAQYLTDVTSKMKTQSNAIASAWSGYQSGFANADGNDVGSSTSLMFNEFIKDIELLKNAKIGIPAGQQTGGQTLPTYVEGYYSQSSIDLAKESVLGLKETFLGGSGSGFDDYIRDVESEDVTVSLADNIINQFDVLTAKLDAIGSPLSDMLDSNPTGVNEAWQESKKLVTYCKTDMSSALGLLITFQDNDGD